MSLIPEEELRRERAINFAPMVDFLFLVIAILATLAITKAALYDSEVSLVKIRPSKEDSPIAAINEQFLVNISVSSKGSYKWITEVDEYQMRDPGAIQKELLRQHEIGLLPKDKSKTKVLLHIDRKAEWEPIAKVIFSVRESGFQIHPVYEPIENEKN